MVTPRKSPLDMKSYRAITLSNGLKVLLISSCDYQDLLEDEKHEKQVKIKKEEFHKPKKKNNDNDELMIKRPRLSESPCKAKVSASTSESLPIQTDKLSSVSTPQTKHETPCNENRERESEKTGSFFPLFEKSKGFLSNTLSYFWKRRLISKHECGDQIQGNMSPSSPHTNNYRETIISSYLDDLSHVTETQKRIACRKTKKYDMKACVAFCVGAGFFNDPEILPGTAHLLEHVMLMGCEKYPQQTYFDDFLQYTGGNMWNGNTDGQRTIYFFDTSADYLDEAFDILTEHIKSPLLSPKVVAKERENVDAEFRKAVPIHQFRCSRFLQTLAMDGHPYRKFSWGNVESLTLKTGNQRNDSQVCEILRRFHKTFYSADAMFMCLRAPETLNNLEIKAKKYFECIPIRMKTEEECGVRKVNFASLSMPFEMQRFNKLYKIFATSHIRKLIVNWQLPSEAWKAYDVKPLEYLAMVLLSEHQKGLSYYLRKLGLITDIQTNPTESNIDRNDACAIFSLHFSLTKYGCDNFLYVLEGLFSYIKMMIHKGPQHHIFMELYKIKAMEFHYLNESDPGIRVKELCEDLRLYPSQDVITGPILVKTFDKDLIHRMTTLLVPDQANYLLFSKEFRSLPHSKTKKNVDEKCVFVEKYFKIQYTAHEFPASVMERLKTVKPSESFCLPQGNIFIPTNFFFALPDEPNGSQMVFPAQIIDPRFPKDRQPVNLWLFADQDLLAPEAVYTISISSPIIRNSPHNAVMLDIFVVLLEEFCKQCTSPASMAMLQSTIESTPKGIYVRLSGFSDKMTLLLTHIIDEFSKVQKRTDECQFNLVRARILENYENKLLEPCQLSSDVKKCLLIEPYWDKNTKFRAAMDDKRMTLEEFYTFISIFTNRLLIRVFLCGNVNRRVAHQLLKYITDKLSYAPVELEKFPKSRVLLLPLGIHLAKVQSYSREGDTSVVKSYFQIGLASYKTKVICDYIIEVIFEPLFHELRTKKQLSYSPDMILKNFLGVMAIQVNLITQADKHRSEDVDEAIDDFLEKFYIQEISKLNRSTMDNLRRGFIQSKMQMIQSRDECKVEWEKIVLEHFDFRYLEKEIKVWRTLTESDVKTFYKKYLLKPSVVMKLDPQFFTKNPGICYRKLSLQVVGFNEKQRKQLQGVETCKMWYSEVIFLTNSQDANTNSTSRRKGKHTDKPFLIENCKKFKESLISFPPHF